MSAAGERTQRAILICLTWRHARLETGESQAIAQAAAKFLTNEVFGLLGREGITIGELPTLRPDLAEALGDIAALRAFDAITSKHAKDILEAVWATPYLEVMDHIVASRLLDEVGGDALGAIVRRVIEANPAVIEQIRAGKVQAAGFLVGQVMKQAGGKADPKAVREAVEASLAA